MSHGHRDALSGEWEFVVSWMFSSDMLGRSCHAELIAFRLQHDDVVEDPLVIFFPHNSGAACNKLGHLWLGSVAGPCPTDLHQPRGRRYGVSSSLTSPLARAAIQ
jgi:hypothetical protein